MMQFAATGRAADPMPSRISAWAVYDVFTVKDGEQIFLAAVSDKQWTIFCKAFGLEEMLADPRLATNNDRVLARDWMMPMLRSHLAGYSAAELSAVFEKNELPFAPIAKPQELFEDPHLNATGGLAPIRMNDGSLSKVPLMPFTLGGERLGVRIQPPLLGEHTNALLKEVGYSELQIAEMQKQSITTGD
jgi:crotonobetainyl-CoA:carnitine CoA-transferase CaiB-like acyl-CoA transferase